jgi:hypothetical protein
MFLESYITLSADFPLDYWLIFKFYKKYGARVGNTWCATGRITEVALFVATTWRTCFEVTVAMIKVATDVVVRASLLVPVDVLTPSTFEVTIFQFTFPP